MSQPYVLCQVEDTHYAIAAADVQQLEMIENVTRVPGTPDYLDGVVYLRGQVVPVLNLRRFFGAAPIPYDLSSRLVIVRSGQRVVGLAVDSATEFKHVDDSDLQPPPETFAAQSYLSGVVALEGRLFLVLDVHRLLEGA